MSDAPTSQPSVIERIPEATQRRRRAWRMFKDGLAHHGVTVGGIGVIIAVVLIFFYLLYVVFPLLTPGSAEPVNDYAVPGEGRTLHLAMEEQAEIAVRFTADEVLFFRARSGEPVARYPLPLPADVKVTAFAAARPDSGVVAYGLSDGRALVVHHDYRVTYPDDKRLITPQLKYPLGEAPVAVDPEGRPLQRLAVEVGEETSSLAGLTTDGRLLLSRIRKEESFLGGDVEIIRSHNQLPWTLSRADYLLINPQQRILYAATRRGELARYDISDVDSPALVEQLSISESGSELTSLNLLAGGISLLAGYSDGHISQWFTVRDEDDDREQLRRIRGFDAQDSPITLIVPEYARKGLLAADARGGITIYHTTAHNRVLSRTVSEQGFREVAVSPRADYWLAEDDSGRLHYWKIDNEHPEISWSSLWGKVWYESYDEPAHIWQSSSASNDFEPKFSLTPLAFGTIKAAFYAMLIGTPLAILGAIYTSYFMAPKMRGSIKPTIEIMEALPTVILGFLAGLWLAPYVETHLPGIFSLLIVMPFGVLLFAYLWHLLPWQLRTRVPDGWEAAMLIPVVLFWGWLALTLSPLLEAWMFGGDMRLWLKSELGLDFDQRNSIVVGLAMGFAVIPTIFSITEDAIFNVPKHLTSGSLALGATPWQTLTRVVLLTASPGIFSAVMIGMGRAVGETMIVLMATGNTPVMDMNIFQGMRTLSANIAVEMPESAVGSTHYRVLFLAALVLFMFTFVVNTLAEFVRQRLRRKYASL
ncbi:MAG: phosphate ABC transporter permease [Gammaproteobacteria bacterium]|nr:phosphate ABC transporter permease [Gammaproteobacteria bacterium]